MTTATDPWIIDLEASGLQSAAYPIEVGVALDEGRRYCALIAPLPDWTHWDRGAEKVHRIPRDILETYGKPPEKVADDLNDLLAGKTLYTDGWVVDKPWLIQLFHAAGREMDFAVSPLEMILCESQMDHWTEARDAVIDETDLVRHRASTDAWIIQETYRRTRPGCGG